MEFALRLDMMSNGGMAPKKLQLYSFFLSPPSFSVRIALNLKGLDFEYKAVNLFKQEHHNPEYLKINPIGYVPALKDGDFVIADSSAIVLYLEDKYRHNSLLPKDLEKRALNYQAANIITSSIQPLLRLPILSYIGQSVGLDEKIPWVHRHVGKGFSALEKLLKNHAGKYATGDEIFLADVFLAPFLIGYPQRYNFDMSGFTLLLRLREAYMKVPAIQNAMPEKQPDFPMMN